MSVDLFIYEISRGRIEAMDCSHAVREFDPGVHSRIRLRERFGRVLFCVGGYDAHPDELYVIPEVRAFVRQFRALCPNWLFYASLHCESLKTMYLSLLDSVESLQLVREGRCRVTFETGELVRVLTEDISHADELAIRAGLTEAQRLKRVMQIVEYFGLKGGGS